MNMQDGGDKGCGFIKAEWGGQEDEETPCYYERLPVMEKKYTVVDPVWIL